MNPSKKTQTFYLSKISLNFSLKSFNLSLNLSIPPSLSLSLADRSGPKGRPAGGTKGGEGVPKSFLSFLVNYWWYVLRSLSILINFRGKLCKFIVLMILDYEKEERGSERAPLSILIFFIYFLEKKLHDQTNFNLN